MEVRKQKKNIQLITITSLGLFLLLSAYFYFWLDTNPFIGIRAERKGEVWQVKKINPEGLGIKTNLAVGDTIIEIDQKNVETNKVLEKFLIVEQAHSITTQSNDTINLIQFENTKSNELRYLFFMFIGICGFLFLFNFIRHYGHGRYTRFFYSFILLTILMFVAIVPSSRGNELGRFIVIVYISVFPIFLNVFVSRDKITFSLYFKRKLNRLLVVLALMNLWTYFSGFVFMISNLFREYLSVGVFYNFALCLFLILLSNFKSSSMSVRLIESKVNIALVSFLSLTPLYLFYLFPTKWWVPLPIVIIFGILPIVAILHLLTISQLVSFKYKLNQRFFRVNVILIVSIIVGLIALLSEFLPFWLILIYSFLLIYALFPLMEELILLIRKREHSVDEFLLFSALEEERENISTFIHDTIMQDIIYVSKKIEVSESGIGREELLEVFDDLVYSLRELCADIYPLMIQELGLQSSLMSLAGQFEKKYPVIIHSNVKISDIPITNRVGTFVLRSVKELINNSIMHGKATVVNLTLAYAESSLFVKVTDNGHFSDSSNNANGLHFGLVAIRERVKLLKGNLSVDSSDETTITISIPIENYQKEENI